MHPHALHVRARREPLLELLRLRLPRGVGPVRRQSVCRPRKGLRVTNGTSGGTLQAARPIRPRPAPSTRLSKPDSRNQTAA
ncbi:MAG: hypothetical protein ACJAYU_004987 [Bradymonadia bacterium]